MTNEEMKQMDVADMLIQTAAAASTRRFLEGGKVISRRSFTVRRRLHFALLAALMLVGTMALSDVLHANAHATNCYVACNDSAEKGQVLYNATKYFAL